MPRRPRAPRTRLPSAPRRSGRSSSSRSPGGPNRIIDGGRSSSIAQSERRARARARAADRRARRAGRAQPNGQRGVLGLALPRGFQKRSATREVCCRPDDATGRGHRAPPGAPPARHGQPAGERDAGGRAAARLPRGEAVSRPSSTRECRSGRTSSRGSRAGTGRRSRSSPTPTRCSRIPAEWDRDPWSGELVDGEVWGRGALDMKGQVAAGAVAFASLVREGFEPAGDLALRRHGRRGGGRRRRLRARVAREEHPDAVRVRLRGQRGRRGAARLGRDTPVYLCATAEKMSAPFTVRVYGRSGHASMPGIADNALVKAARYLEALGRLRAAPRADPGGEGPARGAPRRGAAARGGARTRARRSTRCSPRSSSLSSRSRCRRR